MDLENCVKLIPKRISKVESFLRKNLPQVDSTCARYYEVCVVENKGALLLRYVVLTDESIIITQNPPKSIIQMVKLSQVEDIALVADRGTLIKGGNNNSYICQHVRVVYEEKLETESLATEKNGTGVGSIGSDGKVEMTNGFIEGSRSDSNSSRLSSVEESSLSGSISISTDDKSIITLLPENATTDYDYPHVPSAIRRIYEPQLFRKLETENLSRATSTTGFLDVSFNHSDDSGLSSGSVTSDQQQNKRNDTEKRTNEQETKAKDSSRVRRSKRNHRISKKAIVDKDAEESSNFDSSSGSISIGDHPKENDVDLAHRANSALEQRELSWTGSDRDTDEDSERKRRTRSIDNSQLTTFRKKLFGKHLSSGNNGKSNSHNNINNSKVFAPRPEKDEDKQKEHARKVAELNIYLYRPDSLILNELFLLWNRHTLKFSLEMDESSAGRPEQQPNFSLRAAEKILTKAHVRDGISLLSTAPTSFRKFSVLLHPLWTLHKSLLRYQHLKLICWKNLNLIGGLLDILKHCTSSGSDGTSDHAEVDEERQSRFLEKLSAFAITMDIFRLLYQSCSTSFLVQSTNNNFLISLNRGKESAKEIANTSLLMAVAKKLLDTTFSFSSLFAESRPAAVDKIECVIFDPQNFAKGHWLNTSESKAIKLITIAHNASVSTLFEIISILHFSPRDNDKTSFMSYIQTFPTDSYLRQSVTQVINLLSSNRPPMKSAQCVLLYQHVSILKTLLDNLDNVKSFLRITFCEEFQYFVHGRVASVRIPDRYPIKPKLLLICIELRNEIVHKVPSS